VATGIPGIPAQTWPPLGSLGGLGAADAALAACIGEGGTGSTVRLPGLQVGLFRDVPMSLYDDAVSREAAAALQVYFGDLAGEHLDPEVVVAVAERTAQRAVFAGRSQRATAIQGHSPAVSRTIFRPCGLQRIPCRNNQLSCADCARQETYRHR
jgi:hypothetical protein